MGNRKFKGFIITEIAVIAVFGIAKFGGVEFTGNDITTIIFCVSGIGGAFFTANWGEHAAAAKKAAAGG